MTDPRTRLSELLTEAAQLPIEDLPCDETTMALANTLADLGHRIDGVLAEGSMYWTPK